MSDPMITVEEYETRLAAALASNQFVIVQLSKRRYGVARLKVHIGQRFVGSDMHGMGMKLTDFVTADLLPGYEKLDGRMAFRALYRLKNGLEVPPP